MTHRIFAFYKLCFSLTDYMVSHLIYVYFVHTLLCVPRLLLIYKDLSHQMVKITAAIHYMHVDHKALGFCEP